MEVFGSVFSSLRRPLPKSSFGKFGSIRTIFIRQKNKGIALIKDSKKCFTCIPKLRRNCPESDLKFTSEKSDAASGAPDMSDETENAIERMDFVLTLKSIDVIELAQQEHENSSSSEKYAGPGSVILETAKLGYVSINDPNYVRKVSKRFRKAYLQKCAAEPNSPASIIEVAKSVPGFQDAQKYYPALTTNLIFSCKEMATLTQNGITTEDFQIFGIHPSYFNKSFSMESENNTTSPMRTIHSSNEPQIEALGNVTKTRPGLTRHVSFLDTPQIHTVYKNASTKLRRRYSFNGSSTAKPLRKRSYILNNSPKKPQSFTSFTNETISYPKGRNALTRKLSFRSSRSIDYSCKLCPKLVGTSQIDTLPETEENSGTDGFEAPLDSAEWAPSITSNSSLRRTTSFSGKPTNEHHSLRRSYSFSDRAKRTGMFRRPVTNVNRSSECADFAAHEWLNMPEEQPPTPDLRKQMKTAVRTVSRKISLAQKKEADDFKIGVPPHLRYQLKEIYVY
ncbi:uncharacterized protein LOC108682648 isoform X1 [Hyalella azteca]|uniref:Uncharacterized protein LOC108682648 isoform X1 n=1 Tax=Hyalella azteca TaxID=294128 RepID=A0A8B7PPH5_HYAAZ|nr:uncharacterized protein LOC108682648 isoform X1 [Hyalella azteca]